MWLTFTEGWVSCLTLRALKACFGIQNNPGQRNPSWQSLRRTSPELPLSRPMVVRPNLQFLIKLIKLNSRSAALTPFAG
jgi:hypothetical protein